MAPSRPLKLALSALAAVLVWAFVQASDLARGDFTGNGYVNSVDFALFRRCLGFSIAARPDCSWADLNDDGNITSIDFAIFKQHLGLQVFWVTVGGPIYSELHTGSGAPGTRVTQVKGAAPGYPCRPLTFSAWNTVQAGPYVHAQLSYVWGLVDQGFTLCEAYNQVVHFPDGHKVAN